MRCFSDTCHLDADWVLAYDTLVNELETNPVTHSTPLTTDALSMDDAKMLVKETALRHVAVVMDGNRRWAKEQGLPTLMGHKEGVNSLKNLLRYCGDIGVQALTVYAFSTENWKRSQEEVGYLMGLFIESLKAEINDLDENGVRLRFIGSKDGVPDNLAKAIKEAETLTDNNTGVRFQIAFNYGGRLELTEAMQAIAESIQTGEMKPEDITEEAIEKYLYTQGLPELDLLIRTGGEFRLSNYLLWQAAYAEIYVTETLWPDFNKDAFNQSLIDFQNRHRRYGK